MMLATPVRNSEWSSTTSTRARGRSVLTDAACGSASAMARARNREGRRLPGEHDLGPRACRRDEGQLGADALGALAHAGHAEPIRPAIPRDAAPVVGHREPEADATDGAGAHGDAPRVR